MTNNTCPLTKDPSMPCTRGFMGHYVVLATKKEHIKAGVDFAREHNLRLIVRNTGHDFMSVYCSDLWNMLTVAQGSLDRVWSTYHQHP
jgi:hypothetical protein